MTLNLTLLTTALTTALNKAFTFTSAGLQGLAGLRRTLFTLAAALLAAWLLVQHPPLQTVPGGELAVRTNLLTGSSTVLGDGPALRLPGLHTLRHFPLRDQVVRPRPGARPAALRRINRWKGCRSAWT